MPFDNDDDSLAPRTARTIYELLRKLYSVHDYISGSALYSELCNLRCGSRVLEYVTKWRGGVAQLRAAKFVISFRMVIEQFLDQLPSSIPYEILRFRTMENIDNIPVHDVTTFIKLTDEVLKIDNTYRCRSQPNVPLNELDEPETPPSPVAALSVIKPPVIINKSARRKLNLKSSLKSTLTSHYLVVDTSLPSHIFNDRSLFTTYMPSPKIHQTPFGSKLAIEGIGDVHVCVVVQGFSILFHFQDCWHVPSAHHHFLSSFKLISRGSQIMIAGRTPRIIFPHKDRLVKPRLPTHMPLTCVDGLLVLVFTIPTLASILSISPGITQTTIPSMKQSDSPVVSLHASSSPPFAGFSFSSHCLHSPHLPQSSSPHLPPLATSYSSTISIPNIVASRVRKSGWVWFSSPFWANQNPNRFLIHSKTCPTETGLLGVRFSPFLHRSQPVPTSWDRLGPTTMTLFTKMYY